MNQKIIHSDYKEIKAWTNKKKILLVCGKSFDQLKIKGYLDKKNIIRFSGFTSNPTYEEVEEGVKVFNSNQCNSIIAIGGGSAIDVAKCIKLFSNMDDGQEYLKQQIIENEIPFMVMPTTAGTGSEATRFAVIYKNGEKISISHDNCIPDTVFFDDDALNSLPLYHRKSAMLDAFCHAIESYWSINSTEESKQYSMEAINIILDNQKGYMVADKEAQIKMLKASNIAGKAINITQTTGGHAMCYKLTTLYGLAHGHSAALCVSKLWPYMINHHENINDPRGEKYVLEVFDALAKVMGCESPLQAAEKFKNILLELDMWYPQIDKDNLEILCNSVNPDRLKNNPIRLEQGDIKEVYTEIQKVNYESRKIN